MHARIDTAAFLSKSLPPSLVGGHLTSKLRVIVADDNPAFLEKLILLLGEEFDVVASATDGSVALELIRSHLPDLVVVDLSMPELNGVRIAQESAKLSPSPRIVICSIFTELNVMQAARQMGVSGYVVKARIEQDLIPAVKTALKGSFFASPAVTSRVPEKPQWVLSGTYVQSCNCGMTCPRISLSPPKNVECTALIGWQIDYGSFDDTNLSGLNVAAAMYSPPDSAKWKLGMYIDGRANPEQKNALTRIFTGETGGHPEYLASQVEVLLGVQAAPIELRADGRNLHLQIAGVADLDIEAVRGYGGDSISLTNYPFGAAPGFPAELGRSKHLSYSDYGLEWDFAETSGFFGPFQYANWWAEPQATEKERQRKMTESNWNRLRRRFVEPGHRDVRRANLDRLGRAVLESMSVAGDTPLPEEWQPMLDQISVAYRQNPEHLVVVLWRLLCDFSLKMAKRKMKKKL